MLVGSLIFLGLVLLYWLSGYVVTPVSDEELDRLEMRLDPDASNVRQGQEMRQARIAVSWFTIPVAVAVVIYALVQTVLR
jgi:hypothetical protein